MKIPKTNIATLAALLAGLASGLHAATLVSTDFTSEILSSVREIDLTDPNIVDWGYYEDSKVDFPSDQTFSNTKATSGIGSVDVTAGDVGAPGDQDTTRFAFTFNDGASPTSGSAVPVGTAFGGWGGSEANGATFTFNDLGTGTHTVRLYVGHNRESRVFDMQHTVTASDGGFSGATRSNQASTSGDNTNGSDVSSTYEIEFSTSDPSADLTLQWDSVSGGSGKGWVAGYEVLTVPEPSSFALLAGCFGLAWMMIRRRA